MIVINMSCAQKHADTSLSWPVSLNRSCNQGKVDAAARLVLITRGQELKEQLSGLEEELHIVSV